MGIDATGGHPGMDYAEHQKTYEGFLRGAMILVAALVVLLSGMAYFLT